MVTIELVKKGEFQYEEACLEIKKVYNKMLRVDPVSFPPQFLTILCTGKIVGSIGLCLGEEFDPLHTEKYCRHLNIENNYLNGVTPKRSEVAEISSFFVHKPFRAKYSCVLPSFMHEYAWSVGIKYLFLIKIDPIQKQLDHLGIKDVFLCTPDIDNYMASEEEKAAWQKVYFKMNPKCSLVRLEETIPATKEKKLLNNGLIPDVIIGEKLSKFLA